MIAYKVVHGTRKKDIYKSVFISDNNRITYKKGENQKVPNACCFRTKEQAIEFAYKHFYAPTTYLDISVFKVEIKESDASPTLCPVVYGSIIDLSELPKMVPGHPVLKPKWPKGTIFASEIKLLEEIRELEWRSILKDMMIVVR